MGEKMKKTEKIFCLLLAFILLSVFAFSVVGCLTNRYVIFYNGFAADSSGNIYIGYPSEIKRYNGERFTKSISAQTSRGYEFAIIENDIIYIYCGDSAYYVDLDGNILKTLNNSDLVPFYTYRPKNNVFVDGNGTVYKQKFNFGRTEIVKEIDGETKTVYKMPVSDYCIKIIIHLGYFAFFIAIVFICYRFGLKPKTQKSPHQ